MTWTSLRRALTLAKRGRSAASASALTSARCSARISARCAARCDLRGLVAALRGLVAIAIPLRRVIRPPRHFFQARAALHYRTPSRTRPVSRRSSRTDDPPKEDLRGQGQDPLRGPRARNAYPVFQG